MLRRAAFAALTLALAATAGSAEAQRTAWQIDDGTAVRFVCQGPQVESAAEGRFSSVNARLEMDPTELQTARGAVQVLLASITTDLGGWDAMFRAAPFLALDEHPRATFELLAVEG
ncbi:MAG TPA: YceI family protein, partial [Polyangiaceae bacterium LLY-WYZ-15_(1-7)]|nr:YceI family protein [Polyangiaceae bacterium LLY-WYZ-15_(1-7)]